MDETLVKVIVYRGQLGPDEGADFLLCALGCMMLHIGPAAERAINVLMHHSFASQTIHTRAQPESLSPAPTWRLRTLS